jgi:hypothetical protein
MRAVCGCRRASASIAAEVLALARASRILPSSTSVMTVAEASKYTCWWCRSASRDDDAVGPGHAGAQRHQHVHVAGAAADGVEAADVEAPADPELHRRRQQQLQPAREHVVVRLAPNMKAICATSGRVSAAEIQKRRSSSLIERELLRLFVGARVGRGTSAVNPVLTTVAIRRSTSTSPGA